MSTLSPEFVGFQRRLAGRYSLEKELHRGPLTHRFEARDVALERPVVVEVLRPGPSSEREDLADRFLDGARQAAGLFHPHVQLVHAVDEVEGWAYVVRAPVRGETLARRVEEGDPLSTEEARRLVEEVAWALSHAHDRGVVHGRLSPDHIVLEAETGRAVVIGIGTARALQEPEPAFRAPEMWGARGETGTVEGDLYALGACADFAVTGRADGSGALPPELEEAVEACLAPDPSHRPVSAAEVTSMVAVPGDLPATLPPSARRLLRRIRQFSPTAGIGLFVLYLVRDSPLDLGVTAAVGAAFAWMGTGLVRSARDVLNDGLDLDLITRILEEEARELRKHPDASAHQLQNLAIGCGSVVFWVTVVPAALFLLVVGIGTLTGGGPTLVLADAGVASILLCTFLFLAGPTVDEDSALRWLNFGERMMVGRFGRMLFWLARRGRRGRPGRSLPNPGEPTAVVLSEAVEELLHQLPPDLRREFSDAPKVIEGVRERVRELRRAEAELARTLRELGGDRRIGSKVDAGGKGEEVAEGLPDVHPELAAESKRLEELERRLEAVRERVRERTFELTRTLEHVRLKLLRIAAQAGEEKALTGELTLELERAGQLGSEAEELLRARREVRDLLDPLLPQSDTGEEGGGHASLT